ncbi:MAG TPA: GNAT family protein [Solirubrobacterales bacterium]|jgi:ribosomal-protein-serine acetyltransferase|nr:GNAT family protein [Solirubrobacterales bacterium]
MDPLPIAEGARIRLWDGSEAATLTTLIATNREHLMAWLPWAETHGFEDSVDYLRRKRLQVEHNDGFEGVVELDGRIVGVVGFHAVDWVNRSTSIGYWLTAEAQGRGLMSAAVRALVDHAFGVWELHRVIIEVVVANERSRAIPERLGFTQEAILKEAKLIRGSYEDTLLYAMLAPDWSSSPAREAIGNA